MFVYIAHAEADQAAADDLKAFLKSRGMVVETEDGSRGFRHLQASDVVVALWSQKAVFGTYKMQMERRMLEAWADQRLVLVKLDHGFLPVGMRDLPFVDAGFESGRQLSVWPQVERKAKDAMNAALVAQEEPQPPAPRPKPPAGDDGPKSAREFEEMIEIELSTDHESAPQPSRWRDMAAEVERETLAGSRRSGAVTLILVVLAALALAGGVAAAALGWVPPEGAIAAVVPFAALGSALVAWALTARVRRRASRASATRRVARKAAAEQARTAPAPAAPGAEAFEAPPTAVFISYSHADDAVVTRVVSLVEASGRPVWIDKTGIQTGDGWAGEIVRAIKQAHGVLVMCSAKAFESDHVKREVYLADRYKKPMAPVFLEQASPPEDFEYFFANVQWLELWKLPEADRAAAIGNALKAV